jgi:hypothetical protein
LQTDTARLTPEEPPLTTIRAILLWALVLGAAGTMTELLLIGHNESLTQYVPLMLLTAAILIGASLVVAPGARSLRLLQVLMVVFLSSGILGVGLHYQGNEEFELEMYPSLSGLELISKTMTGATPVLAPGSMSLLGVVGLAFTYRHPLLRRHADVASSEGAQS